MDRSREQLIQAMVALQPRLRRFAYGLSGVMDEANELVQCTYERALPRLDQWQPGTRLDSWLFRILQSIWLNQLRARRLRGEHLKPVDADEQGCNSSERKTEAGLLLERLRGWITELPPDQQAPLLLISVEGMSYKEAAEALEIPVGTLTSRLARGRAALLKKMYPEGSSRGASRDLGVTGWNRSTK